MESMGRGKGFRCRSCGFRGSDMEKRTVEEERRIGEELYMPPPRAQRHLSKPKSRYGREKSGIAHPEIDGQWHWP